MLEKWKRAFTSCPSGRWQTDTVYRIMHQRQSIDTYGLVEY